MRSALLWLIGFGVLAGYVLVLRASSDPEFVDPSTVSAVELRALVPVESIPPGFRLVAEGGGRQVWGPPGSDWRATFGERLFEDDGGNRIAVSVVVTGVPQRGRPLYRYDALCSKAWPKGDCDPQYNAYRYISTPPAAAVGEDAGASFRQCFAPVCGASAEAPGPRVRNDTFIRAGVVVTLSLQSPDESAFVYSADLLRRLDTRASNLARARGIDVAAPAMAKR